MAVDSSLVINILVLSANQNQKIFSVTVFDWYLVQLLASYKKIWKTVMTGLSSAALIRDRSCLLYQSSPFIIHPPFLSRPSCLPPLSNCYHLGYPCPSANSKECVGLCVYVLCYSLCHVCVSPPCVCGSLYCSPTRSNIGCNLHKYFLGVIMYTKYLGRLSSLTVGLCVSV